MVNLYTKNKTLPPATKGNTFLVCFMGFHRGCWGGWWNSSHSIYGLEEVPLRLLNSNCIYQSWEPWQESSAKPCCRDRRASKENAAVQSTACRVGNERAHSHKNVQQLRMGWEKTLIQGLTSCFMRELGEKRLLLLSPERNAMRIQVSKSEITPNTARVRISHKKCGDFYSN